MSIEKRRKAKELYWAGMSMPRIGAILGCWPTAVCKWLQASPWPPRRRNPLRLSPAEREEISLGLKAGESLRSIAERLKRAPSTISREVKAQGADRYRAWRGDERAERLMARNRPGKLAASPDLVKEVEKGLLNEWSPKEIERRLRVDYPDNPAMRVSHETIYKALYIQGRGTLRKELAKHLRQARPHRRPRARKQLAGKIPDMLNISERPAEAADRAVPGHWEGDLIVGPKSQSAIGTLVERSTRYVMLLHLKNGKTAEHVREALTKKIRELPRELWRSLTWDQGSELAEHAKFTIETGVQVFFCDPRSPWQRGSNENTNGLLRQYFPKGTDLSKHTEAELDRVARKLNGRPRETLGWRTPAEKLQELLDKAA
ncbi:MAG: IS30 family transposase [Myxococcaceae bacterium]